MKYIRTKDGIYETLPNQAFDEEIINTDIGQFTTKEIKQYSDTIEELCDNFLVEYTNGEHMMFHDFYHLQRHHDLYSQDYHNVAGRYGCIWIAGKGLIYVAKMNKDGKLELL